MLSIAVICSVTVYSLDTSISALKKNGPCYFRAWNCHQTEEEMKLSDPTSEISMSCITLFWPGCAVKITPTTYVLYKTSHIYAFIENNF